MDYDLKGQTRDGLCKLAESKVQHVLTWLDEELADCDAQISDISVDTRNFANLAVSITTEARRKDRR